MCLNSLMRWNRSVVYYFCRDRLLGRSILAYRWKILDLWVFFIYFFVGERRSDYDLRNRVFSMMDLFLRMRIDRNIYTVYILFVELVLVIVILNKPFNILILVVGVFECWHRRNGSIISINRWWIIYYWFPCGFNHKLLYSFWRYIVTII